MATLGNTTTPTYGYDAYTSTANQAAQPYTMPTGGGLISSVSFYGAGDGSSHNTAYGCVWDSAGNLLARGAGVSTTGGSQHQGSQSWNTDTLTTPLYVAGGTSLFLGWQRSTATTFDWSWANDSAAVAYRTAGSTPSNLGTAVSVQAGSIGAYATYTPNKLRIRRSGVWVEFILKIRRGGVWKLPNAVYVRRSGAWVRIF